jgi:hypothetical protein
VSGDRPVSARTTVGWWPLEFRFDCAERSVVTWFHHHLYTLATATVDLPPHRPVTVTAVVDEHLTDRLIEAARTGGPRRVEGHVGEFWTVAPTWRGPTWCHGDPPDAGRGRHAIVAEGVDRWLVAGVDPLTVAKAAVRLGREMLRTELAGRGAFTVHASIVAHPACGGVMFLGPTGGGKTTLALALARDGGYLVSGDQSEVLTRPGGGLVGVGFPWISRVGAGTLAGLGTDAIIQDAPLLRPQPSMSDGRFTARAREFRSPDKLELTMLELDALLGAGCMDVAPVDALVVLDPAPPDAPLHITPTDHDEVCERVRAEYREPDPVHASFWLAPPDRQPPDARAFADFRRTVADLPVYRLSWNAGRHAAADAVAAVRRALGVERSAVGARP